MLNAYICALAPSFIPKFPVIPSAPSVQQPRQKPRYTKAEKRAYARQQKAATGSRPNPKQDSHPIHNADPKARLGEYSNLTIEQIDDQIHLLSELRRLKANASLESRVAGNYAPHAKKEKKELSPKKLEKIQKRREVRAAKKAAWLAKKTAESNGQPASVKQNASAAEHGPSLPDITKGSLENDNINWGEL